MASSSGQPVEAFRVIPRDRDELFRSLARVARFHIRRDPPTSYLSLRPQTAVYEVSQGIRDVTPDRNRLPRVAVRLTATLNLCDEGEREMIGLTEEEILGPKVPGDATHEARLLVARRARAIGVQGLWYPSRMYRPHGVNLVLFLENTPVGRLDDGALVEILDRESTRRPRPWRRSSTRSDPRSARTGSSGSGNGRIGRDSDEAGGAPMV